MTDRLPPPYLPMPRVGLGTWNLRGAEGQASVEAALALGYRHLDTAEMYANEEAVGAAVAAAGMARGPAREDLFVTSKAWHDHLAPRDLRAACERSLARLGLDRLDLYLVHWPAPGMDLAATLGTLDAVRRDGLARAVGVANFPPGLLRRALATGVRLDAVQVEHHALLGQDALLALTRPAGIALTAYSPLAQGRLGDHPALAAIGTRIGATPSQVALAWLLAREGVAAIPKSARAEGQRANLAALAVRLAPADVAAIDALPKDVRVVDPSWGPDWAA